MALRTERLTGGLSLKSFISTRILPNPFTQPPQPRRRSAILFVLLVVIILGLGSRRFPNALPAFLAENSGDALWTVAAYLTAALIFPNSSPARLGFIAFGVSLLVETSQLLQFPWLVWLRDWPLGRLFLGSGFLWIDWVRYAAGAIFAVGVDSLWQHRGSCCIRRRESLGER